MRSPALSGGTPRRLFLHAGKWVLELVRHVNVGQDLIRPATVRLTGQRAIASYFKYNPDKALLGKATLRLMQSNLGEETRSYYVEGSDWSSNSIPPPRGDGFDSLRPPSDAADLELRVNELEAKTVVLTAVQEGLLTRLARLEAKLSRGEFVPSPDQRQRRPAGRRPIDGGPSAVEPMEPPPGSENLSPEPAFGAPESHDPESIGEAEPFGALSPEPELAPGPLEQPAKPAEPVTPARNLLTLPSTHELAKCVALLIGGDVTAKEGVPPLAVNRTTVNCYAAALLDDNDQTVGMILMDLRATVFLGGTLMMLPRAELEQQLRSLTPGEDSIAASAEICNALSGAINGFQEQHVRVGGLEKFEFEVWRWVNKPADRRDLEDSFGGRTVIFTRPPPVQIG